MKYIILKEWVGVQYGDEFSIEILNLLFKKPIGQKAVNCAKASSGSVVSSLFKSWSLAVAVGVGWGNNGGSNFTSGYIVNKYFKTLFSKIN